MRAGERTVGACVAPFNESRQPTGTGPFLARRSQPQNRPSSMPKRDDLPAVVLVLLVLSGVAALGIGLVSALFAFALDGRLNDVMLTFGDHQVGGTTVTLIALLDGTGGVGCVFKSWRQLRERDSSPDRRAEFMIISQASEGWGMRARWRGTGIKGEQRTRRTPSRWPTVRATWCAAAGTLVRAGALSFAEEEDEPLQAVRTAHPKCGTRAGSRHRAASGQRLSSDRTSGKTAPLGGGIASARGGIRT